MIAIRKARPADAVAIAAVHVAAWRNTYPGILPDAFLAKLSVSRQAVHYDQAIRAGTGVMVAIASGVDVSPGGAARIIGFTTAGHGQTRYLHLDAVYLHHGIPIRYFLLHSRISGTAS